MGTSSGERRMDSRTTGEYGRPGAPSTTGTTGAGTGVEQARPSDTHSSPGATGNSTGGAGAP
jgi:hypothetical protein